MSFIEDVPILQISNVACSSEFETAVISELALMQSSLQQMNKAIVTVDSRMKRMDGHIQQLDKRIIQMDNHLQVLEAHQDDACNFLLDKTFQSSGHTGIDFKKKYKLQLPIDDMDSFLEFEQLLSANDFLKSDVCAELSFHIDKNFCTAKSYLCMLRAFITKNIATKFTASRIATAKENPKQIFKSTELYRIMESVLLTARKTKNLSTTEKELMLSLSNVLSNAGKWSIKNTDK